MGGRQRSTSLVCLLLLLLAPWTSAAYTLVLLRGGGVGLGFVPPLVMWRYDHLLPSTLVLFVGEGLSLGVEGELPASCIGTPLAW